MKLGTQREMDQRYLNYLRDIEYYEPSNIQTLTTEHQITKSTATVVKQLGLVQKIGQRNVWVDKETPNTKLASWVREVTQQYSKG